VAAQSLKEELICELDRAFELIDETAQAERLAIAIKLSAELVNWAKPLLEPMRYKCLYGGRGCVSGDTLIDTPNGLIRVDAFAGGEVYSYDRGKRIVTIAGMPVKYSPEPLYKVIFRNGISIKVTAKHRFLTTVGWVECQNVSDEHDIVSFSPKGFCDPLRKRCSFSQSEWREDALHCWQKLLGFLYGYFEDRRQYDPRLHAVPDTYRDILQQLADAPPHTSHVLKHEDDPAIAYTSSLSQFLLHLSNLFAHADEVAKNWTEKGSCSGEIFSVLPLASSLVAELSREKSNHFSLVQELSKLLLVVGTSLDQAQTPQTVFGSLFGGVGDSSYSDRIGCTLSLHCTTTRVESIDLYRVEPFYDFFVPFFNNYLTEGGIVNHNSGKSYAAADCLLVLGLTKKIRVLCAREFQVSIKESVHALLKERISALGLEDFYRVSVTGIDGSNGTSFIFKGVRLNVQSIKSMAGLTHLWLEEGQTISAESWQVLVPTIRETGSEIWVTFNPLNQTDAVYQELVEKERHNAYVRQINWDENPNFPGVLNDERVSMQATDPDTYHHIWEGGFWEQSDAQILRAKWVVEQFSPYEEIGDELILKVGWNGPYLGADFGFASSPTTLVQCWIAEKKLYIEAESYGVGLELDDTADRWTLDIPDCDRHVVRGDSARPESISYLKRHGVPRITGVKKWPGSVEDGIAHLRSYEQIVIHPRCKHTIEEARLYSYKVDRLSGDVLPVVVDAHNHCIDGIRYALQPLIKQGPSGKVKRSGISIY